MFRTIADFAHTWQYEQASTHKVLGALTDASLAQKVSPDGRTLGRLAWHIVETLGEMGTQSGLPVTIRHDGAPQPATAAEIAAAYAAGAQALVDAVTATWNDDDLLAEIPMYGERWTRGMSLEALVKHEVHHRGQMTVLMRQAGLRVPGVYGPAREEWVAYGKEPQD